MKAPSSTIPSGTLLHTERTLLLKNERQRKLAVRTLWNLCVIAVIVGTLLPNGSPILRTVDYFLANDKFEHFFAYAILAFLPAIHERFRTLIGLLLFTAAMGVLLESAQAYSPDRGSDIYDIVANGFGMLAGTLLGLPLRGPMRAWLAR